MERLKLTIVSCWAGRLPSRGRVKKLRSTQSWKRILLLSFVQWTEGHSESQSLSVAIGKRLSKIVGIVPLGAIDKAGEFAAVSVQH